MTAVGTPENTNAPALLRVVGAFGVTADRFRTSGRLCRRLTTKLEFDGH